MCQPDKHEGFLMKCVVCDNEAARRGKFCSHRCQGIFQKKPCPPCINCGKPSYSTTSKFCSRRCSAIVHNAARVVFRSCLKCGAQHKNKFYCSYACSAMYRASLLSPEESREKKRLSNLLGVRRYQARRLGQCPADADHEKIATIYRDCPEGHEVDHIIPVSKGGLHHQDNLQYLPKLENRRKFNKLDYTPVAERLGN